IQAPVIFLSTDLGYRLAYNEFIQIDINSDNVNLDLISNFNFYKGIFTNVILNYVLYLENFSSENFNPARIKVDDKEDFDYMAFKILASSLETFYRYADSLGIDFYKEFSISDDIKNILHNFFMKENYADTIPDLFILTIRELIKNGILSVYNRDMLTDNDINYVIVEDKGCIWLTANVIDSIVIPKMGIEITRNRLLKTLKIHSLLYTYQENYRVKRTVMGKQIYFFVFLIDISDLLENKVTSKQIQKKDNDSDWNF
ncbi:MAG: hypothetical protein ACI4VF_04290, partial [Lachnospirales bacterium]